MNRTQKLLATGLFVSVGLFAQQPVTVPGWAGGTLGAMANYGTSPGAVLVPGVNSFVTNTVTVTGSGSAGSAASGVVTIQGIASGTVVPVTFSPSSTSGAALSIKHVTTGAAVNVKASAGNLYGFSVGSTTPAQCWLQFYNTAGTPTIGTSVIDSYPVQAGLTFAIPPGPNALENFATGIGIATAASDSGSSTTNCVNLSVTVFYQ